MSLKFVESTHRYYLDGKSTPGVTTLIGQGLPKPALPNWAARTVAEYVADNRDSVAALWDAPRASMVAALKQTPWVQRDEAAARGTDVHALAEQIVHGQSVEVPEHLVAKVEGYARWLDTFQVEPLLTEVPVASRRWGYCGKPDFIGRIGAMGDDTWLCDWKTSRGVYGETALQTSAYAKAEFYVNPPTWDEEHPLPEITRIGVVHITDDGTHMYDLGDVDSAFQIFTHVQWVAKKTDHIKRLIGEPITEPQEFAS